MKITLKIKNTQGVEQDKEFVNNFVRARHFREALRLNESLNDEKKTIMQSYDEMAEFVVKVFDNQFTLDDLWDGIAAHQVQTEIKRIFDEVLGAGGFMTLLAKQIPEV